MWLVTMLYVLILKVQEISWFIKNDFKVFLWTGTIKAVQGDSTQTTLHNFSHSNAWVTQEEIKAH